MHPCELDLGLCCAHFFRKGNGLTYVVYGAIIVVIARFLPSGLLSLLERRR